MAFETVVPTTRASGDLISGTLIGRLGSNTFVMRLRAFDLNFWVGVQDTIGDGKTTPQPEHNGLQRGRHVLPGWMLANEAIGLASLHSHTDNVPTQWTLNLGANETITHKVILERIRIIGSMEEFVTVIMTVWLSDSEPSEN